MRSSKETFDKFDKLRATRLSKRKSDYLSKSCLNCKFNKRIRVKGRGRVGFCTNEDVLAQDGRDIVVCDEDNFAKKCKAFECKNTVESVEGDFSDILRSPTRCGSEYPKLAILLWFLQGKPGSNNDVREISEVSSRSGRLFSLLIGIVNSIRKLINFGWW